MIAKLINWRTNVQTGKSEQYEIVNYDQLSRKDLQKGIDACERLKKHLQETLEEKKVFDWMEYRD